MTKKLMFVCKCEGLLSVFSNLQSGIAQNVQALLQGGESINYFLVILYFPLPNTNTGNLISRVFEMRSFWNYNPTRQSIWSFWSSLLDLWVWPSNPLSWTLATRKDIKRGVWGSQVSELLVPIPVFPHSSNRSHTSPMTIRHRGADEYRGLWKADSWCYTWRPKTIRSERVFELHMGNFHSYSPRDWPWRHSSGQVQSRYSRSCGVR